MLDFESIGWIGSVSSEGEGALAQSPGLFGVCGCGLGLLEDNGPHTPTRFSW